MSVLRRASLIATMSAALITGSTMVAVTPAAAYPQGCSAYVFVGSYGRSYCSHGSGSHRVRVSCAREGGQNFTKYGPWVGTGSTSTAYCNARTAVVEKQGD